MYTSFTYTSDRTKKTYTGFITIKENGKASYSLPDKYVMSSGERSCMKDYAVKNVTPALLAKFEEANPAAAIEKIISILTAATETLRIEFIAQTKGYAKRKFDHMSKFYAFTNEQWYSEYGEEAIGYKGRNLGYRRMTDAGQKLRSSAWEVCHAGYEAYESKEVKNAELHYTQSIVKLAHRIVAKRMKIETLTAVTGHVGINIETIITDGDQRVRAHTIIASGPIQRPHYRYLVN